MRIRRFGIATSILSYSIIVSCGDPGENSGSTPQVDTVNWVPSRPLQKRDTVPLPVDTIILPDSSTVYLFDNQSKLIDLKFGKRVDISVDGDMFFEFLTIDRPTWVHTKLLDMEIAAPSAFRVMADRKEEGEEIQVVFGEIRVKKTYPSDFPEPDTIRNQQLVMINRTIDLMEKEKLDTKRLSEWYESKIRKAVP